MFGTLLNPNSPLEPNLVGVIKDLPPSGSFALHTVFLEHDSSLLVRDGICTHHDKLAVHLPLSPTLLGSRACGRTASTRNWDVYLFRQRTIL